MMSIRIVVALVTLVACAGSRVDTPARASSSARFEALDASIRQELERGQVPGAAVAVVHDGEVVYAGTHGVADVQTSRPVRPDTAFALASVTKTFTATAVLMLAEDGVVDLMAPIATYLPDLPPKLGALTLQQLLEHTGGLRSGLGRVGFVDDAALARACLALDDDTAFHGLGDVWSYSNTGYALAGCVAAAASGTTYADLVRATVLDPLGMHDTTFDPLAAMSGPLAVGHRSGAEGPTPLARFPSTPEALPAAGLISTLDDMTRFAQALADAGRVDDEQALPASVVRRLLETSVPATDFGWGFAEYGHGLFGWTLAGQRVVNHQGLFGGFGADLLVLPDAGVAVVVLANRTGAYLDATKAEALRLTVGIDVSQQAGDAEAQPGTDPTLVGRFDQGDGACEIELRDGQLHIIQGATAEPLVRVGPDVYRVAEPTLLQPATSRVGPRINFSTVLPIRDDAGDVIAIQYLWRVRPRR